MGTQIQFRRKLASVGPGRTRATSYRIRESRPQDAAAIEELARSSFHSHHGHYHADSRLSHSTCDRVYSTWAARCCQGGSADAVAVAEINGEMVGFMAVSWEASEGAMRVVLLAVKESVRGLGLNDALGNQCRDWGRDRGLEWMLANADIGNTTAINACIAFNMSIHSVEHTFHLWLVAVGSAD